MRARCVMGAITFGVLALALASCSVFTVTVINDCYITEWTGGYAEVTVTDNNTNYLQNIPFMKKHVFDVLSSDESRQVATVTVMGKTGVVTGLAKATFAGQQIGIKTYNVDLSGTNVTNIDVSLKSLDVAFCASGRH